MKNPRLPRKVLLRLLLSVVLLFVVLQSVDVASFWTVLTRMSLPGAIAISLLYAIGQAVSASKWRLFVQSAKIPSNAVQIFRAYFFGMFVNTFGLGTIGGDITRALLLRPKKGERSRALATVACDRIHGLLVLLGIACLGVSYVQPLPLDSTLLLKLTLAVSGALLFLLALAFFSKSIRQKNQMLRKAAELFSSLSLRPRVLFTATLLSLFVHGAQIAMHVVIARDLHTGLSLPVLIAIVPLVNIASALPFSINGIGVRESMYLLFLVPQGLSPEVAVAFGAIWLVCVTVVSALGGLLLPPEARRELHLASRENVTMNASRKVA